MKLALVRRHYSATGGAELYLQRLLPALQAAGHEIHLYSEAWPEPPSGIAVHTVSCRGTRAESPRLFAETVQMDLRQEKFDVIFSLERTTRQDVYRAGDGVHASWLHQRRHFAPWWKKPWIGLGGFHQTMKALEKQTFDPSKTGRIIANSAMVRDDIVKRFRFPAHRIHIVRNGIDFVRIGGGQRSATRAGWNIRDEEKVILFVGSGWERKGLRFVLKAFKQIQLPGTRLVVVGKDRPLTPRPQRVIFTGPMSRVEDAYAAADLFVFLPIYEPSSNVVIEALAAGLPVITSRYNGAAELIRDGLHGSVVDDPSDTPSVVDCIARWIGHPRLEREICLALDFGLERNVRETIAVLEQSRRKFSEAQL